MTGNSKPVLSLRSLCGAILLSSALMFHAEAAASSRDEPAVYESAVLSLDEAANLLRISPGELKVLSERNEVPARRIGSMWRYNREALLAWLNGDWRLINVTEAKRADEAETPNEARRQQISTADQGPQEQKNQSLSKERPRERNEKKQKTNQPIGEAPQESTADQVFLRGRRVLLAPGSGTIDIGQFFARSDSRRLVAIDNAIGLANVERDASTTLLLGRIGVFDETEFFAGTTYRSERVRTFIGEDKLSNSDQSGFGDVRVGVRRTLAKEALNRPNIIATLEGRIPTDDGAHAVGGGISLVKSLDPAILFGSVNYRRTLDQDDADIIELLPEDRIDATLGYALALNDKLTISTSVSGVFTGDTEENGLSLREREAYSLQLGLTSRLPNGLFIEPSVSFDLGGSGDDVVFGVVVPYRF